MIRVFARYLRIFRRNLRIASALFIDVMHALIPRRKAERDAMRRYVPPACPVDE
jgi:hypothetical protein